MLGPWLLKSCQYGAQLRGWPVPASLFLEDVDNLLKWRFAITIGYLPSSWEKQGSVVLESNWYGVELPSPLKFCHKLAHVGKPGSENFILGILFYCVKNLWLQLRPVLRLTRAGSRLGGFRTCSTVDTVLVLRLIILIMGHLIINRIIAKHRGFSLLVLSILNLVISMELNLWLARTHVLVLEDVTYLLECFFTPRFA